MTRRKHEPFERDPQLEALLALRDTDPAAWRALPAWQKITLGCYEGCRAYAEDAGEVRIVYENYDDLHTIDEFRALMRDERPAA